MAIDVISMLGSAIDTVQKLREVSAKIKNAEMLGLIADLQMQIVDAKIEAVQLKQENLDLRQELKVEQERKASAKKLIHRDGVYWLDRPEAGENPGPFCPNCSTPERPIAIKDQRGTQFEIAAKFRCPQCKGGF